jgi:neutral ceramidase
MKKSSGNLSHKKRKLVIALIILTAAMSATCYENEDVTPRMTQNSSDGGVSGEDGIYLVGSGIYDITGPAAEVGMMGFAVMEQKTSGIHMRLRSRAFIIGDGNKRVVFVSTDTGMMFQAVKMKVAEKLQSDPELGKYYDESNVCLSAIHTHSGPGGYSHYFMYNVTILGFIEDNFNVIVEGIYESIKRAHNNLQPGKILINTGTLDNCGWQRSDFAYQNNPQNERDLYKSNTDTSFTLLKLVTLEGEEVGMINWFAVHPTNIGPENTLISGDNKGYASYLFERDKGTDYQAERTFVAAFAQANAGDISPNVPYGPAPDSIDFKTNTGLHEVTMRQYEKAVALYNGAAEYVKGSVDFRHEYKDMRTLFVEEKNCVTCAAAMGASFASGSPSDNPSPAPLFPPGVTRDSIDWTEDAKTAFLAEFFPAVLGIIWPDTLDEAYVECHEEKPILIPTGIMALNLKNIPMTPQIMPVQVLKVGSLIIAAQPTEVTTMAGRRLKFSVLDEMKGSGVKYAVVAGLANSYASYMATREEYAMQSYAGACTQFGPNELAAFQQEFRRLCAAMKKGEKVEKVITPPDLSGEQHNFLPGVVFDDKPVDVEYGDTVVEPAAEYNIGDTVEAVFWGGHLRNNPMIQKTFLEIVKVDEQGNDLAVVARDWNPETELRWKRDGIAYSKITIRWRTENASRGMYVIRHYGYEKSGWTGRISPYEGETKPFTLQ